MKHKPYPQYKPSGVEWIGEIPEGWEVKRFKNIIKSNKDAIKTGPFGSQLLSSEMQFGTIKVYNQRNVISNDLTLGEDYIDEAKYRELNPFTVESGDILMTTRGTIGKCLIVPNDHEKGILHPCLMRIQCNENIVRKAYLARYIESKTLVLPQLQLLSNATTIDVVYSDTLKGVIIPLPPLDEQESILGYLNLETTRIDTLIAKKQQQIELLKEKRTALITHAVTKGLDPHAKMKPSGIEWLGDIPDKWEIKKFKFIGESIIGLTYKPEDIVDEEFGLLVLRSSNVQNGEISYKDCVYVSSQIPDKLITRLGDILICSRNGSRALIGKNALIDEGSVGQTFGAFMTIFRSKSYRYIYYVLNSQIFEFQSATFLTSTINQLTSENLINFETPFPSMEEQAVISDYLDKETAKIDKLIDKVNQSISLLLEYRTALITAVVTGKVEV